MRDFHVIFQPVTVIFYDFLPKYGIIGPAKAYRASNPGVSLGDAR